MCKQCELKPVYEFTNKRKLCKNCFVRYFQKKVLYTIRKFKMIQKGDTIYCENSLVKRVLGFFEERGIISFTADKKKANKIAVSDNLDKESNKIIHEVIKGNLKNLKSEPTSKKTIKPLYLFLDDEIKLYAKLNGINCEGKKVKQDRITKFVNNLEIKHPEIKRAIVNSYLELY